MPYKDAQRIKNKSKISGIPKIIQDEALRQHKKISEMRTFRGFNRDGIIAASIYIASRIHNYPRTAKEIATIFQLDQAAATKGCKNAGHLLEKNESNMDYLQFERIGYFKKINNNLYHHLTSLKEDKNKKICFKI